ncbi:MAG: hypothetical protein LDL50_07290 [Chloroflexi bacterium]|nr:hypothetical protein [Chloroflexota bacterium]
MFRPRPNLIALFMVLTFAQACAPPTAPTPFRPPTPLPPTSVSTATSPPAVQTVPSTPTIEETPTAGPCFNALEFISDVTIPDGTTVSAGSQIDKQWLVNNSGSCNWDAAYRLKWVGGDPLGAAQEQFLPPAKAGNQTIVRIFFTAPLLEGSYESQWQAYSPEGIAFGNPVFIKVVVIP